MDNILRRNPLIVLGVFVAIVAVALMVFFPSAPPDTGRPSSQKTTVQNTEISAEKFIDLIWQYEEATYIPKAAEQSVALTPLVTDEYLNAYRMKEDQKVTDVTVRILRDKSPDPTWEESSGGQVRFVTAVAFIETVRNGKVVHPAYEAHPHHTTWIKTDDGWKVHSITEMR